MRALRCRGLAVDWYLMGGMQVVTGANQPQSTPTETQI